MPYRRDQESTSVGQTLLPEVFPYPGANVLTVHNLSALVWLTEGMCSVFISDCLAGTKGVGGGCDKCPTGYYQPDAGQTVCVACDVGDYADSTGSASCTDCPEGQTTPTNASTASSSCTGESQCEEHLQ